MYSLGLIFHFYLTKGSSPVKLTAQLVNNNFKYNINITYRYLDQLTITKEILASELIKKMIDCGSKEKISIEKCLESPYFHNSYNHFWQMRKILFDMANGLWLPEKCGELFKNLSKRVFKNSCLKHLKIFSSRRFFDVISFISNTVSF